MLADEYVDVELYLTSGEMVVLADVPIEIALDILNSVGMEGEDEPDLDELGHTFTITWNTEDVVAAVVRAE